MQGFVQIRAVNSGASPLRVTPVPRCVMKVRKKSDGRRLQRRGARLRWAPMLFPTALPSLGYLFITAPAKLITRTVTRRALRLLPRTTPVRTNA